MNNFNESEFLKQCQEWFEQGQVDIIEEAISNLSEEEFTPRIASEAGRVMIFKSQDKRLEKEYLMRAISILLPLEDALRDDYRWNYRMGVAFMYFGMPKRAEIFIENALELMPDDEDTFDLLYDCINRMSFPTDIINEPFRDRVGRAWEAFMEISDDFYEYYSKNNCRINEDGTEFLMKCSSAFKVFMDDVNFVTGGADDRPAIFFSSEGKLEKLFMLRYFRDHAPEDVLEKWHIKVGFPPIFHDYKINVEGIEVGKKDIEICVEVVNLTDEEKEELAESNDYYKTNYPKVNLFTYCPKLEKAGVDTDKCMDAAKNLLATAIGELPSYQCIKLFKYTEETMDFTNDEIHYRGTLDSLYDFMISSGCDLDVDLDEFLDTSYTEYELENPHFNEDDWDYMQDVLVGSVKIDNIFKYYLDKDRYDITVDYLYFNGAIPMFFYIPYNQFEEFHDIEEFVPGLLDRIVSVSGWDSFEQIGLHSAKTGVYLDLLAYDYAAVISGALDYLEEVNINGIVAKTYFFDSHPYTLNDEGCEDEYEDFQDYDHDCEYELFEDYSIISGILPAETEIIANQDFVDRINALDDFEIVDWSDPEDSLPGEINFIYNGEYYSCLFDIADFTADDLSAFQLQQMPDSDIVEFDRAKTKVTIVMDVHDAPLEMYHVQLKILHALVPNMIGMMDYSSVRLFNKKWVELAANSEVTPMPDDFYSIHAVVNESGDVWIHTHGLMRAGLTELEILGADEEHAYQMYNLINTFASRLIDDNYIMNDSTNSDENDLDTNSDDGEIYTDEYYLGQCEDGTPIIATALPWEKGIKEYEDDDVQGLENDRIDAHNHDTSIIFVFKDEEDYEDGLLSKPMDLSESLGENPIYMLSTATTNKMIDLAAERLCYFKESVEYAKNNKDAEVVNLCKIRIDVLDEDGESEHIWFEIKDMDDFRVTGVLTQTPYYNCGIVAGDTGVYPLERITDWKILTNESAISPRTVYLLD